MTGKFLTEQEELLLTLEEKEVYRRAKLYCADDWANGPYGGWVRGNQMLEDLGWRKVDTTTESDITSGISKRTSFVKPERLTISA